jgi:adenosylcobinamide kinase/adenosylcobinamide-phosphate guanylyltransferase
MTTNRKKISGRIILILGGARSGKSAFALELASKISNHVLFVATAEPLDEEMKARIIEHQQARPTTWRTLEAPRNIGKAIESNIGGNEVIIIDCLTLLVSNLLCSVPEKNEVDEKVIVEINDLITTMEKSDASFIIVSNEVGLGLVPDNSLGRIYRDLLGKVNQLIAQKANEVYFMVAGLPIKVQVQYS